MRQEIQVGKTAVYHTLNGEIAANKILYVIHGYAQLAETFLEEFNFLKGKAIHVVAPEALNRFYGKDRKPVSNWMTSHEREAEIKDYVNYLKLLHQTITANRQYETVNVLGFSQGLSTAFRWIANSNIVVSNFFCCCGSIPPELTKELNLNQRIKNCNYYYGDQDRLMLPSSVTIAKEKLNELNISFEYKAFEGRHEIGKLCIEDLNSIA